MSADSSSRRSSSAGGPLPGQTGWLALSDDDLLFEIESLPEDHEADERLLDVVRSGRHFFVRQEAAKRIANAELLKVFAGDRHIGQILVRQMCRDADVDYLEQLVKESRHLEVRNAARVQLERLLQQLGGED